MGEAPPPDDDATDASSAGGSSAGASSAGSIARTIRSTAFGSRLRTAGTLVVGVVLVAVLAYALGVVGVPTVDGTHSEFGAVNDSATVVDSTLAVHNPNPVGAGVLGVSGEYTIAMNDVRMANGSTGSIDIPPGNSTIDLRTTLANERIPAWWVSHVTRDEQTTVRINATVESDALGRSVPIEETRSIDTDMLSSFNSTETRPIDVDKPLVDDPLLYVNETTARWGETSRNRTGIVVDFYVYNPKSYAIPLSRIDYTIDMNDVRVGDGSNTDERVLAPKELTRVRTVTSVDNQKLDDWWVSHVERDQVTDLVIDFDAAVDVSGTSIQIPLDAMTHEETIRTDVFGTKDDTAPGDDSSGNATGDDTTGDDGTTSSGDTSDGDDGTTTGGDPTTTEDGPLPGARSIQARAEGAIRP